MDLAALGALGFHEGEQIFDRSFHDVGSLDNLRQEHLAGAEQVADDVHAVHERAFDDLQRPGILLPGFLDVRVDVVGDAVDERVLEAFLDGASSPFVGLDLDLSFLLDPFRELEQSLSRVRPAIEHDILDVLQQVFRNFLVNLQLPRVDDPHVEPGLDRVIEKDGVDRFAHGVIAAKAERDVANAPRGLGLRISALQLADRIEKLDRVVGMFLHARPNRHDVRVENDVGRIETDFIGQQFVCKGADLDFVFSGDSLSLRHTRDKVLCRERHDNDGSPVAFDEPGFFEKLFDAGFQADRVDDTLALQTLEPRFDDAEIGAVKHDRHTLQFRLVSEEMEERDHRFLAVDQVGVHVDVEDVGAPFELFARNLDGGVEVAFLDQAFVLGGAGDVAAFADHDEIGFRANRQDLGAAEVRPIWRD